MSAGRQLTPVQQKTSTMRQFLGGDHVSKELNAAIGEFSTPKRMVRFALTAMSKTPKLLDCRPETVALALCDAARLELEPNGRDAYLVPYGKVCQLLPGYRGLIQLAYRSGIVVSVDAMAVREKDVFSYELGSNSRLYHLPSDKDDPGELTHAWAMVKLENGAEKFVVLNKKAVLKRKAASKATGPDSPWTKWPEAMWAKSAVHELAKWMPQTPGLDAFHAAERHEADTITVKATAVTAEGSHAEQALAASLLDDQSGEPTDDAPPVFDRDKRIIGFRDLIAEAKGNDEVLDAVGDQIADDPDLTKADRDTLYAESHAEKAAK